MNDRTSFLHTAVKSLLFLCTFTMPFFVLRLTLDPHEVTKQFLIYALITPALLLWLIDGVLARKFVLKRTVGDVALLIFIGALLISSVFSVDRKLSFLGDFGALGMGFLPLLGLAVYAFLLLQEMRSVREAKWVLGVLGAGALVAFITFLLPLVQTIADALSFLNPAYFGAHVRNMVALSNNEFGVVAAAAFVTGVALLTVRLKSVWAHVAGIVLVLVGGATVVSIGFTTVFTVTVVGLLATLVFSLVRLEYSRSPLVTVGFALLLGMILLSFFGTPRPLRAPMPLEISLGTKPSQTIAWSAVVANAKQFLIGSGPSTFVYDFSRYRPESFNQDARIWQVRFAKPHNTLLAFIAEIGIVGTLAFVFFVLVIGGALAAALVRGNTRKKGEGADELVKFLFVISPPWVLMLASLVMLHASTVLWFIFIALSACIMFGLTWYFREERPAIVLSLKTTPQYSLAYSFGVVLFITGGILFMVFSGRWYAAEATFSEATRSSSTHTAKIAGVERALTYAPQTPRYLVVHAQTLLLDAYEKVQKRSATDREVAEVVVRAVGSAKRATELAPRHVAMWDTLATMYENAYSFAPSVNEWIIRSLETTVTLESTNPNFHLRLGLVLNRAGRKTEAKEHFEEAVRLKPDYVEAVIGYARFLESGGDVGAALAQVEKAVITHGLQVPEFYFEYGRLLYNRNGEGDRSRAESALKAAVELNPRYADAHFTLGLLYEKTGNYDAALASFKKVAEIDSANVVVKQKIRSLEARLAPKEE